MPRTASAASRRARRRYSGRAPRGVFMARLTAPSNDSMSAAVKRVASRPDTLPGVAGRGGYRRGWPDRSRGRRPLTDPAGDGSRLVAVALGTARRGGRACPRDTSGRPRGPRRHHCGGIAGPRPIAPVRRPARRASGRSGSHPGRENHGLVNGRDRLESDQEQLLDITKMTHDLLRGPTRRVGPPGQGRLSLALDGRR